jgi:molecular chaperone GrpE
MMNKDKEKRLDEAMEEVVDGHLPETEQAEHDHKKKKKKEDPLEELKNLIVEKEAEIAQLKEKQLYQHAEFENFKKLKMKEKQDALRYGNESLVKELLPVIDNLERAIEHAGKSEEAKSIVEGITLTLNGFTKALEKFNVCCLNAKGCKFDPNVHEAVLQVDDDQAEPGTVIGEFQKGYVMEGRLLRPSMVSVAKGP